MSHESEKLYFGSWTEERDFSLPFPAGAWVPIASWHNRIISLHFPSPGTWDWGAHGKLMGCCFVLRMSSVTALVGSWFTDQVNTLFCVQKPGRQKHTSAVSVVKCTVDSLGGGNSDKGPVDLPRALLPSNSSTWWPHQESMTGWHSLQPPVRCGVVSLCFKQPLKGTDGLVPL